MVKTSKNNIDQNLHSYATYTYMKTQLQFQLIKQPLKALEASIKHSTL